MTPQAIRPIRWQKFEQFILDKGCTFVRQKGSHRVYSKPDMIRPIIIPAHTFEIPVGVISSNLRTLGVSQKEYIDYMSNRKKKKYR